METKVTKVIIADDHLLFADGVEQILTSLPGFEVMAKVQNGKLLLQTLNHLIPDLLLLDINMPLLNGLDAAMTIRKQMLHEFFIANGILTIILNGFTKIILSLYKKGKKEEYDQ